MKLRKQLQLHPLIPPFLVLFVVFGTGCSPDAEPLRKLARIIEQQKTGQTKDVPPSFTAGSDQKVEEDAGPQTVQAWATELSSGMTDPTKKEISFLVVKNTNEALFAVQPAVDEKGTLTYAPAENANGIAEVSLVAVNERDVRSEPVTVTFTVTPVEDLPAVLGQALTIEEDVATTVVLRGTDADGDPLTFQIYGGDVRGTLSEITGAGPVTASVFFTPETEAAYSTSFTFTADDGKSISEPASVDLTVVATNDRPEIRINGQPQPPYPVTGSSIVAVTESTEIRFFFSDAEALDQNNDARAPYYFRLAFVSWPEPDEGIVPISKVFSSFDINGFAKDAKILKPNFAEGVGGWIQFSSSVGVANEIFDNLTIKLNQPGEYGLEIVTIDNGFLGRCPAALIPPDPAELGLFDADDYRKKIGRDGDLLLGNQQRCIRETTHALTFDYSDDTTATVVFKHVIPD